MNGILNIHKESGYTSHDVVAKLRGILHIKKIGHTGTLDPDATGVLPVCIGKATKVCDIITDRDKTYEAEVLLGVATDTLDVSGEVKETADVDVNRDELEAVLLTFIGDIEQVPPMYSAIKIKGKKLYEYAREGIEVERKKRQVTIHSIENVSDNKNDFEYHCEKDLTGQILTDDDIKMLPSFSIRVSCSKGTYIRTLCEDIGKKLGTVACMKSLVRTGVGRFDISEAIKLDEVEELVKVEKIEDKLIQIDEIFDSYKKVFVKESAKKLLLNGNPIVFSDISFEDKKNNHYVSDGEIVRVYDDSGIFYALYKCEKNRLKVYKYFAS